MASLSSNVVREESAIIYDDSDDYGSEIDAITAAAATESDYGSDWDSVVVDQLTQSEFPLPSEIVVLGNEVIADEPEAQTHSLRLARVRSDQDDKDDDGNEANMLASPQRPQRLGSVEVEYDERNRVSFTSPGPDIQGEAEKSPPSPWKLPDKTDTRSPIERFRRTKKKKNMTVTDVVGPGYCEVKFWYNLTNYGKTPTTNAMKQGTQIHKQKELEVHTEVPVAIATKEDKFGLRLWNIIQGLRTLRITGLTRELEVMGLVEGEAMIGIIDEVTETCPDDEMEQTILEAAEAAKSGKKDATQRSITDFLPPPSSAASLASTVGKPRMLYLSDIKTRNTPNVPRPAQMKQTQMQLMMYRRLLLELAANTVDSEIIFERYDVDPNKSFSDTFIASMGSIDFSATPSSSAATRSDESNDANDEFFTPVSTQPLQDPLEEVLAHTTLTSLWAHMIAEFARTISVNLSSSNVSDLLTAEFRNGTTGQIIGTRSFGYQGKELEVYVRDVMKWWKGEREPRGVEIEDAIKCRWCEFAERCEWRKGKVEEVLEKGRLKKGAREKSTV